MKSHVGLPLSVRRIRLIGWLGPAGFAVSLLAGLSWAGEPVKIGSLLADPRGYNMKLVNVEGVVTASQMNHFIGSVSKLEKCVQRFLVKDDTGTIDAVYTTLCQKETPIVEHGDRVTIEAHFSGVLEVRTLTKN
jgi:hypothetical protein